MELKRIHYTVLDKGDTKPVGNKMLSTKRAETIFVTFTCYIIEKHGKLTNLG